MHLLNLMFSHLYVTKNDLCQIFPSDQISAEDSDAVVPLVLSVNSPNNASLYYNENQNQDRPAIVIASSQKDSPITAKFLTKMDHFETIPDDQSSNSLRLKFKEIQGFYDDAYLLETDSSEGPSDMYL